MGRRQRNKQLRPELEDASISSQRPFAPNLWLIAIITYSSGSVLLRSGVPIITDSLERCMLAVVLRWPSARVCLLCWEGAMEAMSLESRRHRNMAAVSTPAFDH
ncbi:hypothetical protein OBBRIDRAFT_225132 [Obba rivulosa]|uniref:Uncharacterized protein n=1 Tax=Obba rivulosa TaxID=1052685 RepID=A0A8E2ALM4_9APHY|nr:hypothetical protein OBBRIDRAFT_225132 [Obba rivulosa]